jgi:hypothetical protein
MRNRASSLLQVYSEQEALPARGSRSVDRKAGNRFPGQLSTIAIAALDEINSVQ